MTEAIIDAATLLQQSAVTSSYSVLSCYGTNGFTQEHQAAIRSLPHLKEIIFAFDGDDAGRKAVAKYAALLRDQLPQVVISSLELPAGDDVNSVFLSHEPGVLEHLLNERKDFFASSEKVITTPATVATSVVVSPGLDTGNPYKLGYSTEKINYYVQGGLSKVLDSMKVTLVVERRDNGQKSRNKVDLYEDRQIDKLAREVGERLQLDVSLLETDLHRLTDLLDSHREKELVPPVAD
ncbi:toprim domain-containing protein [Chitinophaga varians]|uniref:toprim domain-containing protein n=1 Tax=Chitinophaga varians TaxID=2202339 RepID=UPI0024841C97|nr:toprim domain-containing protein [Chitinophaga varians]